MSAKLYLYQESFSYGTDYAKVMQLSAFVKKQKKLKRTISLQTFSQNVVKQVTILLNNRHLVTKNQAHKKRTIFLSLL